MSVVNDNRRTFLSWVRIHHPDIYSQALKNLAQNAGGSRDLGGLGDDLLTALKPWQPKVRNKRRYRPHVAMGPFGAYLTGFGAYYPSPYSSPTTIFAGLGQDDGSDDLEPVTVETPYLTPTGQATYDTSLVQIPGTTSPTTPDFSIGEPTLTPVTITEPTLSPDTVAAVTTTVAAAPTNSSGSSSLYTALATGISNIATAAIKSGTTTSAQQQLLNLNAQRAQMGLPPVNAAGQVVSVAPTTGPLAAIESMLSGSTTGGGISIFAIAGIGVVAWLFLRKRASTS